MCPRRGLAGKTGRLNSEIAAALNQPNSATLVPRLTTLNDDNGKVPKSTTARHRSGVNTGAMCVRVWASTELIGGEVFVFKSGKSGLTAPQHREAYVRGSLVDLRR